MGGWNNIIGRVLGTVKSGTAAKAKLLRDLTETDCCPGRKKTPALWVLAACVTIVVLWGGASPGDTLPTVESINSLAEKAKIISDKFMQEGFEQRGRYEYRGKFLNPADREKLHALAREAGAKLREIEQKQNEFKQVIEDYQGDDWDLRYGVTGLWRRLAGDAYVTGLSRCEIDFYAGLSAAQARQNEILSETAGRIDLLNRSYDSAYSHLLKARVFTLRARTEPEYKASAKKELDLVNARSDVKGPKALRAAIERMKLFGEEEPGRLRELTERVVRSSCNDDFELILSLGSLQRRLNQPVVLEMIFRFCPQAEDFFGSMILSEISAAVETAQSAEQILNEISVHEAELAAWAAWKAGAQEHRVLLNRLYEEKRFQTPLIMYVVGSAIAESEPARAVGLLTEAGRLQQHKTAGAKVDAERMAEQAAQLAYNLLLEGSRHCTLVLKAFENYRKIAKGRTDEEIEYLYAVALNDCGQGAKAKQLLERIAERPGGKRRNRARLDMIRRTQRENLPEGKHDKTLANLRDLIADCDGQRGDDRQVRTEALELYCQLLFESKDKDAPQKIMDVLTGAETELTAELNLFKSRALQQLGRLDESVDFLLVAASDKQCEHCEEVMEVLSQIVDEIERFAEGAAGFMENCGKSARICYGCLEGPGKRRAGLFLAEISLFSATKRQKRLSELEELVDNISSDGIGEEVELLRCRARLFGKQDRFAEAAQLWARIAQVRANEQAGAEKRSWKWWRARFYELYYWSKGAQTKRDVVHAIEVLENSFSDIPRLWAEKLGSLKHWCGTEITRVGK